MAGYRLDGEFRVLPGVAERVRDGSHSIAPPVDIGLLLRAVGAQVRDGAYALSPT